MREPTNITIELFKGDPTKGHHGWGAILSFTHPENGEQVKLRVKGWDEWHETVEEALKYAAVRVERWNNHEQHKKS